MLVVGLVSTREEQQEIRFIAQMCILKNRIQYLASQSNISENKVYKEKLEKKFINRFAKF